MLFQPTLPARGATRQDATTFSNSCDFNPRSRTGSDDTPHNKVDFRQIFQPTLPHGERRRMHSLPWRYNLISTHAPARGATPICGCKGTATVFQPTLPHGERLKRLPMYLQGRRFQPTLPHGERPISAAGVHCTRPFQPTLPHGERRHTPVCTVRDFAHFNPRSRTGSDTPYALFTSAIQSYFNPRSPHGERRQALMRKNALNEFQPTLPARGATKLSSYQRFTIRISTHAPRTGSDPAEGTNEAAEWHFNPRSPHGERLEQLTEKLPRYHFNPRSPHGERRAPARQTTDPDLISTHAPRTGSDRCLLHGHRARAISTHAPRTGSDAQLCQQHPLAAVISTHAPRTGSDRTGCCNGGVAADFNPRSPHGERRTPRQHFFSAVYFNPRSPHGERPGQHKAVAPLDDFNPRSPHGERPGESGVQVKCQHFNPRSPHGERQFPA